MIELIFVIVILGILAAVAIPKLAATRDDATNAKVRSNVATCLSDAISAYTAQGTDLTGGASAVGSDACTKGNYDGTALTVSAANDVVTVTGTMADGSTTFSLSGLYKGNNVSY